MEAQLEYLPQGKALSRHAEREACGCFHEVFIGVLPYFKEVPFSGFLCPLGVHPFPSKVTENLQTFCGPAEQNRGP